MKIHVTDLFNELRKVWNYGAFVNRWKYYLHMHYLLILLKYKKQKKKHSFTEREYLFYAFVIVHWQYHFWPGWPVNAKFEPMLLKATTVTHTARAWKHDYLRAQRASGGCCHISARSTLHYSGFVSLIAYPGTTCQRFLSLWVETFSPLGILSYYS